MYIFCCSNSLSKEELIRRWADCRNVQGDELKAISLPCSGKVDVLYLVKAFETGADAVAIVMCKQNECRNLEGNMRARKRAEAVDSLLEEVGMGRGRMAVIQLKDAGVEKLIDEIEEFRVKVRNLENQGSTHHSLGGSKCKM
jgi:coenzyme F420-reducing hydrogenase delta subunit